MLLSGIFAAWAVRTHRKCRQQISLCGPNPAHKLGRDRGPPSAQDEAIARGFDCRADNSEVLKEIASDGHIAASPPGGTASLPPASRIGPIGPTPDVAAASLVRSVLWVLCPPGPVDVISVRA
jgi:hypothetical protein